MRQCIRHISLVAVILLPVITGAQTAVTLQDQINAQYKVAKMAGAGSVVVEAGTELVVQKAGIKAMPFRALPKCPAKFENNTLHLATGFFCTSSMALQDYFQKGNKVYPLKIEINPSKEKITFTVVSCDECNGVNPPTGLKGTVDFQFYQGYLEKAGAGEVEDTIGQVFSISNDDQQSQGGNDSGQQQQSNLQPANQQPTNQPPPQQPSEPQTVQLGMTTDQVQQILGKPEKIFNLGPKQIFVYKDVKVTFQNGKVNDVQ
jgi:hypothetical protein